MADKKKFQNPGEKQYSVRDMLTQERIQTAIRDLLAIQRNLLETLADEPYQHAEAVFDTAIASLIAHQLDVDIREVGNAAGRDAAAPVLRPAT